MSIPTGLHRILGQDTNLVDGQTVGADSVAPTSAIIPREIERQGLGQARLTGPYTGHQDALVEVEVIDADGGGAEAIITDPQFNGAGNPVLTDLAATAGTASQTITLTLRDTGTRTQAAGIEIAYGRIFAATAGVVGNDTRISLNATALTSTPSNYSVIDPWPAGSAEQAGEQWDWGGLPLLTDGTIDPATQRIAFDADARRVYRQYKRIVGRSWVYVLSPAPAEEIPSGTPVYIVAGERDMVVQQGSDIEYTTGITTWYDMLVAIRESALLDFDGVIAADRLPGGQAVTDVDLITTSYIQRMIGEGTRYVIDYRPIAAAMLAAPTERIIVECTAADRPGAERWDIRGSISGDLGQATTGVQFDADPITMTIPVHQGQTLPSGEISFERTMVTRGAGEREPDICLDGYLGPNAIDRTLVFVYAQRPPAGCECQAVVPAGQLSEDCLGKAIDLDDIIPPNLLAGLRILYAQRHTWIESNTGIAVPDLIVAVEDNDVYARVMTLFRASLKRIADDDSAYGDWAGLWDQAMIELWRFIGLPGTEPARWLDTNNYGINNGVIFLLPSVANDNGRWYYADTRRDTIATGATEPAWNTDVPSYTADGPLTWSCQGLTNIAPVWTSNLQWTGKPAAQPIQPTVDGATGHSFLWTPPDTLTSGITEPTWPIDGGTVDDGECTWIDLGDTLYGPWTARHISYPGIPDDPDRWCQPTTPNGHRYYAESLLPTTAPRCENAFIYWVKTSSQEPGVWPTDGGSVDDTGFLDFGDYICTSTVRWRDKGLIDIQAWTANTPYPVNATPDETIIYDAGTGHYYKLYKTWSVGASEPIWSADQGNTVSDGNIIWIDQGPINGATAWQAGEVFPGTSHTVTRRGTSGAPAAMTYACNPGLAILRVGSAEPIWPIVAGESVIDGDMTWTDQGLYAGRGKDVATDSDIAGYLTRYQARLDEMEYDRGITEPDTVNNIPYRARVESVMATITAWHVANTFIAATADPDLDELAQNADNLRLLREIAAAFLVTLRLIGDDDSAMSKWDQLWTDAKGEMTFLGGEEPAIIGTMIIGVAVIGDGGNASNLAGGYHREFAIRYRARLDALLIGIDIIPDAVNAGIGGQCYYDPGDEYVWRPQGLSRPDAFTNWWYPSMTRKVGGEMENTQEWYLAIKVAPTCIGYLKVGDRVTVYISVTGGVTATYERGDKWNIDIVHAETLRMHGGIDGDDTHTWSVETDLGEPMPDYVTSTTEAPPLYSDAGVQFRIAQSAVHSQAGDRIAWSILGGQWRWRIDGGPWTDPGPISPAQIALQDGLMLEWQASPPPSFVVGDQYQWDISQAAAPHHIATPGADLWRWSGGDTDLDLAPTPGPIQLIAVVGSLPTGGSIEIVGSDDDWATEVWRVVLPTTWPVAIHIPETPFHAARIKLEIRGGEGGYLRWIYLGTPATQAQAHQITVSRVYAMSAAAQGVADGRHAGSTWDAEITWRGLLTGAQLDSLLAMIDHHKQGGDWPVVCIPSIADPGMATFARIQNDTIELHDEYSWVQGKQGDRYITMTLPFKGTATA